MWLERSGDLSWRPEDKQKILVAVVLEGVAGGAGVATRAVDKAKG